MTISNLNLDNVAFQSALRSKPVRENFTDIQNKINEQNTAIAALSTASSGAEVSAARDYHTDLQSRLQSASRGQGNIIITGGVVSDIGSAPNMTVYVTAGQALVDGVACKWAAAYSGTITAPSTNPRYDIVVVNSDSTLSIVTGTEAASPTPEIITQTQCPLAVIYLTVGMTYIEDASISDARFFDKKRIFTSSGWFIKPYGISYVDVLCVGAGGKGGGAVDTGYPGGGGGAGAVRKSTLAVTGNIKVTVGSTGNTSFGTFIANCGEDAPNTINGGAGGGFGAAGGGGGCGGATYAGDGGDYGEAGHNDSSDLTQGGACTGSGGFTSFVGGQGGVTVQVSGGGGGAGYGGNGGNGGEENENGHDGEGYGAGGGGKGNGNGYIGGNGGAGLCIVEWLE